MVPLLPHSKFQAPGSSRPASQSAVRFRGFEDDIPKGSWFADKRIEYFWSDCSYTSDDLQRAVDSEKKIKYLVPSILGQFNNNPKVQQILVSGAEKLDQRPTADQKEPLELTPDFFLSKSSANQYILEFRSTRDRVPRSTWSFEDASVNRAQIPLKIIDKKAVLLEEAPDPLTRQLTNQKMRLLMVKESIPNKSQYVDVFLSPVIQGEGDVKAPGDIADVGLESGIDALRDGGRLLEEMNEKITRI